MAIQIERNLLSRGINSFTMDALTLMKIVSHEDFDTQEVKKRVFKQNEDVIGEQEAKQNDEVSTCAPLVDEVIQEPVSPAQQSKDKVSHFPLQDADDTVYSENKEEVLDEVDGPCCAIKDKEAVHEDEIMTHNEDTRVLEVPAQEETVSYPPLIIFDYALPCNEKEEEDESSNPACYDTDTDIANFDEFIHVGRRRWDVVGYDLDPIYDTESHLQLLPLQLSQQITYDQWQQGDEVFTCSFQSTKDDLVPCFFG
jgi:hypothetical protein